MSMVIHNGPELGEAIEPLDYDAGEEAHAQVIDTLIRAARASLADKAARYPVFEIRAKVRPAAGLYDFNRRHRTRAEAARDWGIAWYALPTTPSGQFGAMPTEPLFQHTIADAEENELGGYLVVARLRTTE